MPVCGIKKNDFLTNSINAMLCLNSSKNFVYVMKTKASLQGSATITGGIEKC